MIEIFTSLPVPQSLTRESLIKKNRFAYENLELSSLEKVKLERVVEALDHSELSNLVHEGYLTFAMIKPKATENILGLSDIGATNAIKDAIEEGGMDIIFDLSIYFSDSDIEEFYGGGPKESQITSPSIRSKHANRWEEFKEYMGEGPTTVMLLFSRNGNAVEKWRDMIGHWNVQKNRDPETIRGRFAKDNYTSLVHGSDSQERVMTEINFVSKHLKNRFFK